MTFSMDCETISTSTTFSGGKDSAHIYTRVSTTEQNSFSSVSMESQETECRRFADKNGLKVVGVTKEVGSAFRGNYNKLEMLKNLCNNLENTTLIFYDVSRFGRNVEEAIARAEKLLTRRVRLVFVLNDLVVENRDEESFTTLRTYLQGAQQYSEDLGRKISATKAEKKRLGFHVGGVIPYGCVAVQTDRGQRIDTLPSSHQERQVLNFISLCRSGSATATTLSESMKKISGDPNASIEVVVKDIDTGKSKTIERFTEPMTWTDICRLLNQYSVSYRNGSAWDGKKVQTAFTRYSEIEGNIDLVMDRMDLDAPQPVIIDPPTPITRERVTSNSRTVSSRASSCSSRPRRESRLRKSSTDILTTRGRKSSPIKKRSVSRKKSIPRSEPKRSSRSTPVARATIPQPYPMFYPMFYPGMMPPTQDGANPQQMMMPPYPYFMMPPQGYGAAPPAQGSVPQAMFPPGMFPPQGYPPFGMMPMNPQGNPPTASSDKTGWTFGKK